MAVLVTRPAPDNERTAHALHERGYEALLAPVLTAERLPLTFDDLDAFTGIIVTSANALRAIADHPMLPGLRTKPLFAVGERTASEARALQFSDVQIASGNVEALLTLIDAQPRERVRALLYLAGEEVSRDIAAALAKKGIAVTTLKTYRMIPVASWPDQVAEAAVQRRIDSVLHYSRRSAQRFVELVRTHGLGASALDAPQCCLSESVADVLRDAGARVVVVASLPNEESLFEALDRALGRVH